MQYITFRLQTDCNQTFHSPSFSIKYALYFLYFSLNSRSISGALISSADSQKPKFWILQDRRCSAVKTTELISLTICADGI